MKPIDAAAAKIAKHMAPAGQKHLSWEHLEASGRDKCRKMAKDAIMGFYSAVNPETPMKIIKKQIEQINLMAGEQWTEEEMEKIKEQPIVNDK